MNKFVWCVCCNKNTVEQGVLEDKPAICEECIGDNELTQPKKKKAWSKPEIKEVYEVPGEAPFADTFREVGIDASVDLNDMDEMVVRCKECNRFMGYSFEPGLKTKCIRCYNKAWDVEDSKPLEIHHGTPPASGEKYVGKSLKDIKAEQEKAKAEQEKANSVKPSEEVIEGNGYRCVRCTSKYPFRDTPYRNTFDKEVCPSCFSNSEYVGDYELIILPKVDKIDEVLYTELEYSVSDMHIEFYDEDDMLTWLEQTFDVALLGGDADWARMLDQQIRIIKEGMDNNYGY